MRLRPWLSLVSYVLLSSSASADPTIVPTSVTFSPTEGGAIYAGFAADGRSFVAAVGERLVRVSSEGGDVTPLPSIDVAAVLRGDKVDGAPAELVTKWPIGACYRVGKGDLVESARSPNGKVVITLADGKLHRSDATCKRWKTVEVGGWARRVWFSPTGKRALLDLDGGAGVGPQVAVMTLVGSKVAPVLAGRQAMEPFFLTDDVVVVEDVGPVGQLDDVETAWRVVDLASGKTTDLPVPKGCGLQPLASAPAGGRALAAMTCDGRADGTLVIIQP